MARIRFACILYFRMVAVRLDAIPVRCLFEMYEDICQILWKIEVFLPEVEDLFYVFFRHLIWPSVIISSAWGSTQFKMT